MTTNGEGRRACACHDALDQKRKGGPLLYGQLERSSLNRGGSLQHPLSTAYKAEFMVQHRFAVRQQSGEGLQRALLSDGGSV